MTEIGLPVAPTTDFADCPVAPDILFVPGGLKGSIAAMTDPATIAFLADRGAKARFVTSVCTGGLVLGAAGLLRGYRATTHWYVRDLLPLLGAVPAEGRVVVDRNRLTAGGVTAGIDFGLTLAAQLHGEEVAKRLQLVLEYEPAPPFQAGGPTGAGPALTAEVLGRRRSVLDEAKAAATAAARNLP
jgi:cyclohexyl-isocyanide hydratase